VDLAHWLGEAVRAIDDWSDSFGPFQPHPSLRVSDERFAAAFGELTERLTDNYPFFHPRYAGQMLKPPHPAAVAGYLVGLGSRRTRPLLAKARSAATARAR